MLDEAVEAVSAAEGSILLLTEDGGHLRFVLSHSAVEEKLKGLQQPLSHGITGLAVSLQQPMIVNHTKQNPMFDPSVDAAVGMKTEAIMIVPLVTPREEFGALTAINSSRAEGFGLDDLQRYSVFAEQICRRLTDLELGMEHVGAIG
jgi:GAF domain-containing protein